jgi:predicted dienelactone hydrolase
MYEFKYTGEEGESTILKTAVWYPTADTPITYRYSNNFSSTICKDASVFQRSTPYPLIVYNHGLYSSNLAFLGLTEYLASHGFIVAAPQYNDSIAPGFVLNSVVNEIESEENTSDPSKKAEAFENLDQLINTSRDAIASYLERFRLRKARFIIDTLIDLNEQSTSRFFNQIDTGNIGMAGHSLGGLTTLGLIGAYRDVNFTDKRIKVALVMSALDPYQDDVGGIKIPVMIMHGDIDIPSSKSLAEKLYQKARSARYYMVLRVANHFTFGNTPCNNHDTIPECQVEDEHIQLINNYATAFFELYLENNPGGKELLENSNLLLATYRRDFR